MFQNLLTLYHAPFTLSKKKIQPIRPYFLHLVFCRLFQNFMMATAAKGQGNHL